MVNTTKAAPAAKAAAPAATTAAAAALFGTANAPVTVQALRAWANANAGGNWANVKIVKQAGVQANWQAQGLKGPVPFGYNGKPHSTRALLQNNLLAVPTLGAHWVWCKTGPSCNIGTVAAHTPNNPVCLLAMLNGGYSPSSATWGTAFLHLTV